MQALDLAAGDSTGEWMLSYPFPYDRAAVAEGLQRLGVALAEGRGVVAARRALAALLTPAEERYLEFQLWQEGVARYVERLAARAAAAAPGPAPEFLTLPDYEPYSSIASRIELAAAAELRTLVPAGQKRLVFYPVGAAMAGLLDGFDPDWRRCYADGPLRLDRFLPASEER